MARKAYSSAVSDEKWTVGPPYLPLMKADTSQRKHSLREVCHGLRWLIRTGAAWRMMPHDLPPCDTVYQQRHH
jgi:transposase